jgi:hypothetical protein
VCRAGGNTANELVQGRGNAESLRKRFHELVRHGWIIKTNPDVVRLPARWRQHINRHHRQGCNGYLQQIDEHYRRYRPRRKLKPADRKAIAARHKDGYTVKDMCDAIDGMFLDEFYLARTTAAGLMTASTSPCGSQTLTPLLTRPQNTKKAKTARSESGLKRSNKKRSRHARPTNIASVACRHSKR